MSVLDTYIANDVIYRVLENGAADASIAGPTPLMTNMFSTSEIVNAMNRIQQKFLLETGMIVTPASAINAVPNTEVYPLPTDSIRPRRVTFTDTPTNTVSSLTQADTWELDNGYANWPSDANPPLVWWENTLPQQQIGIAPSPNVTGTINVLYIALATTLTGLGIPFAVPDDWTPYITWGTLGELLSSDGPAFDPLRAQYCSRRLSEGIELANLVLMGGGGS